jgi:hypothetical protein
LAQATESFIGNCARSYATQCSGVTKVVQSARRTGSVNWKKKKVKGAWKLASKLPAAPKGYVMRINDALFFAPGIKFSDLDFSNNESIIEAFRRRVEGFYLAPARILIQKEQAFACGILCCVTIDFLARYSLPRKKNEWRICLWLQRNIPEFDPKRTGCSELAQSFQKDFRNGLVHEGRVKNLGQFSFDRKEVTSKVDGALLINPQILLEGISSAFGSYCNLLRSDTSQASRLVNMLKEDFRDELLAVKKIRTYSQ